ncbi:MAG TPA: type VII secretion protein EccB [Actinocrinis sp.]
MATRKEQVDAFSFARRRMVSNMVAPTATGSDEFAPRPVRTFLTSFMIGAVAIAAVVVLGVFRPSAPSGWQGGLDVDSASGADYIYSPQDHELHQVYNTTSAKLLLGNTFQVFTVPDSVINGPNESIGAAYGILGAPPDVPGASNVNLTQWNACEQSASLTNQTAAEGKTVLEVGYGFGSLNPMPKDSYLLVHNASGTMYMIDGNYAYPVADDNTATVLAGQTVSSNQERGPFVPDSWLNAFEHGDPIRVPTVPDAGDPVPAALTRQPGHEIGDYGTTSTSDFIETENGLVEVNAFAYNLYKAAPPAGAQQMTVTAGSPAVQNATVDIGNTSTLISGPSTTWPQPAQSVVDDTLGQDGSFAVVCAGFTGSINANGVPQLSLYTGSNLPHPLSADGGIAQSVQTQSQLANLMDVESGHAAIFQVAAAEATKGTGTEFLLPSTGIRYPLAPKETFTQLSGKQVSASAAQMLGYDKLAAEGVPASFAALVTTGQTLDPIAAGQTPPLTGTGQ